MVTQMKTTPLNTCPEDLPADLEIDGVHGGDVAAANDEPENTLLLGKYVVETDFYARVEKAQEDILPALVKGAKYATADICGDELWESFSSSERRFAYLCLKHIMGETGELGFIWDEESRKRYFQLS